MRLYERLQAGQTLINYKESGNSMTPLIYSRQPITLAPVDPELVASGDIVHCKVKGRFMTHLVVAERDDAVLIANNHGHVNGWARRHNVYGIVTHIEGVPRRGASDKIRKANNE